MMAKILIVDDDHMVCESVTALVSSHGHHAACAGRLRQAIELLRSEPYDLVFLDVNLPDGSGLDEVAAIRRLPGSPEVVIVTGVEKPDGAELAIRSGAWDYVAKPLSVQQILLPLERALQHREEKIARAKPKALHRTGIVGSSPALAVCLDLVAMAVGGEVNVLLSGETGTGKELFAKAIHENSARSGANFVVVDCAALPPTLVESVLFGHEKGAFTGADQPRAGLIAQAHRGTLFLDEVGELPLAIQKAFLRVLQERRFRPVGNTREHESDFRLIAASNRNLEQLAADGRFREDLLYRLRGVSIDLPPLRERREDIPELVVSRLVTLCKAQGLAMKGICPGLIEVLQQHDWPGNIRELFAAVDSAFAAGRNEATLFAVHLPADIRVAARRTEDGQRPMEACLRGESPAAALPPSPALPDRPGLKQIREAALALAERDYLSGLLRDSGGDIRKVAETAELSRSQLYRLLQKYRLAR